jgi:hypothetical protein
MTHMDGHEGQMEMTFGGQTQATNEFDWSGQQQVPFQEKPSHMKSTGAYRKEFSDRNFRIGEKIVN